jgi:hypothetical protein
LHKFAVPFKEGELAEWLMAAVLKTVDLNGFGGSNPSLSAITIENQSIQRFTPNFTPIKAKVGRNLFSKIARNPIIPYTNAPSLETVISDDYSNDGAMN